MIRALVAVILVLSLAGCASRAKPAIPQSPAAESVRLDPLAQLRSDLLRLFTEPALEHASWGVAIESLRTGEALFRHNAFKFLLPGSNQKLLSTAVAAERLGWDYRFITRLYATGPIDSAGTLQGDLVVVGGGDPTMNPRHASRWRVFESWASTLSTRFGVVAINGRIVGDDNAFDEPGLGQGWTWENLAYGFGTAAGALQFNENQILVTVTPGAIGEKASVLTVPAFHGMTIDADVVTSAAGTPNTVDVRRLPGSEVLHVVGQIAAGTKPVNLTASVSNPTRLFANGLKAAFESHGIAVSGKAMDIDEMAETPDLSRATELLADYSPTLDEIVDVCLKWSRNEYAETLLRAVAPAGRPAAASDALEVMQQQLLMWGIPSTYVAPMDGSGLSRRDYVTPHALTLLLTYMWRDPRHADAFRSALPVAGVSGTLAGRMKGSALEGRVWAKTGTLANVRGLSGYLMTRAGEPIAFSMLSNNFQVPADEIDDAMERALLRVFEFSRLQ